MKNYNFRLSLLQLIWMSIAFCSIVLSSCFAVKKQYSPGYHIEWTLIRKQEDKIPHHHVLSKNYTKIQTKKSVGPWLETKHEIPCELVVERIIFDSNNRQENANFEFNQILKGQVGVVAANNKYVAKYKNGIQHISKKSKNINQESRSLLITIFITLTMICIALAIYLFISSGFMYGTASLSVLFSSLVLSLAEKKSLVYKIAIALLLVGYFLIIAWWIQFNASWPR